ncbi:MAG: beta-L-arabinofuranosidase domain-containing protein [Thermoguttaceae bacterium]
MLNRKLCLAFWMAAVVVLNVAGSRELEGEEFPAAAAANKVISKDVLRPLPSGSILLVGPLVDRIHLGIEHQLKVLEYPKMVDYFRNRTNPFAAGEFWGKTVRSACLSYQYTKDGKLKQILDKTVGDLLSTQTADGCVSARTPAEQPKGSDLWERKYVLLGLLGYHEITKDPIVLQAMIRMADQTISQVGPAPKTRIVDTGWAFEGMESSTILEPMVRLYALTGFRRYLDFARYIVEVEGACKRGSIFEAAFRGVAPKDINRSGDPKKSIAKAYESMSCFEGLLEYYRATGNEHWKQAAITYYNNIRDQEITIIGSGGGQGPYNAGPGTGEQWNNLAFEQSDPTPRLMMETCVTVTWMKFCYQILRATGDPTVVDQIEKSAYNALAGAQRPSGDYYDYFQNFNGTRNTKVNFSSNIGRFPLNCCTANGPMGMALIPFVEAMDSEIGPVINLYQAGTVNARLPNGHVVKLELVTDYPKSGAIAVAVAPQESEPFSVRLRIPIWSRHTVLKVNGESMAVTQGTYATIDRTWSAGDKINLALDMRCRLIQAPRATNRAGDRYVALARGPLVLARDKRLGGDIHRPVEIQVDAQGYVALQPTKAPVGQVCFLVPTCEGSSFPVIDYASAGNTWDAASEFCTWIPCE